MTPPAPTARVNPTGVRLKNGYRTLITMSGNASIGLWEKTIGLPGLDGGDAIDITNMHSVTWREMAVRSLMTLTEFQFTAAFKPSSYIDLMAQINVEQAFTIHLPLGYRLVFYAALRVVEFSAMTEGEAPEATCTVTPTNVDPITGGSEPPVLLTTAGTTPSS